jgi:FMN phosphatase YigB (HAD superfamily)
LGGEKPSLSFFGRIVSEVNFPASSIAYVGDRYDNDVEPAHQSGLVPILITRGPWAFISGQSDRRCARATIKSLGELPAIIPSLD